MVSDIQDGVIHITAITTHITITIALITTFIVLMDQAEEVL